MSNRPIRDIDPTPKQPQRARLGTRLLSMLPDEWRDDDLAFELPKDALDLINPFEPPAAR